MRAQSGSRLTASASPTLHVFRGPEDDLDSAILRIGSLVNAWLNSQSNGERESLAVRKAERILHAAIKSSPLFGKVLSFAGLNLWVDERTVDGLVEFQESISL